MVDYSVEYWKEFKEVVPTTPSSFASFCLPYTVPEGRLLDVCCGNGRDAGFFHSRRLDVYSFDIHPLEEVDFNFQTLDLQNRELNFFYANLKFHYVYCRFILHSVPEGMENYILINSNNVLLPNGLLFIEARSDKGEIHSGINNHYRRLINLDQLRTKLRNLNFSIIHESEDRGRSVHNEEDPLLIRIVAKKMDKVRITKKIPSELPPAQRGVRILNPVDCRYMLLTVKHILEENHIPFFLIFGTLLGAYRDKEFIRWDSDMDIGLFQEDRPRVMQLVERGEFAVYGMQYRSNLLSMFNSLEYKNEFLDFFYFTRQENLYTSGKSNILSWQLDKTPVMLEFLGESFRTVHDIEQYLKRHYGSDWKFPKKGKHAPF